VYGDKVAEPVAVAATRWASEEFSRGSYSYVAAGCSGKEYDTLALPVARCLLFAGEHTCKEHPDSVGGAMMSGLREAARALQLLRGPDDADAAALVSSRTQTMSKTDMRKRMAGVRVG
jgi:lysine-specific histone demethylase 1